MLKKLITSGRACLATSSQQAALAAAPYGVDLSSSRKARIGSRLITLSFVLQALTPVIVIMVMFALSALQVVAQTPGGNIFGANDQTAGRGIVEFIKYFRNIIFLAGIIFFGWAGLNMGFEKPWGGKALAGVACWGFAAISAVAYSFSQGQAVNLDTDLGN